MFLMDYHEGQGWHDPRIVPYGPLTLDPACCVLHYGQAIFDGMKAFRGRDGRISRDERAITAVPENVAEAELVA